MAVEEVYIHSTDVVSVVAASPNVSNITIASANATMSNEGSLHNSTNPPPPPDNDSINTD